MKAYDTSFAFLPREQWKIINLPSDLMVFPITCADPSLRVNHSESVGKWYVIQDGITPREGEDITSALIVSGSWLDCSEYIPNHFAYVPFTWGKPIKAYWTGNTQFVPIWESVPSGKYYTEDDGDFCGLEKYRDIYKIIILSFNQPNEMEDNVIQANYNSRFEVIEYGEDLKRLVSELQTFTGIIF